MRNRGFQASRQLHDLIMRIGAAGARINRDIATFLQDECYLDQITV